MTDRSYSSPVAFRRALTDRLKNIAHDSRWTPPQLRRQFAYDRPYLTWRTSPYRRKAVAG